MTTENAATGLSAEIVERAETCTLEDLCLACRVERDWITQLVEHGVIEPVGEAASSCALQASALCACGRRSDSSKISSLICPVSRSSSICSKKSRISGLD